MSKTAKISCHRIYHKPSGLYYCPSRYILAIKPDGTKFSYQVYVKSNLSSKGKIYSHKPSLKHIGEIIYSHILPSLTPIEDLKEYSYSRPYSIKSSEEDWEIQEV